MSFMASLDIDTRKFFANVVASGGSISQSSLAIMDAFLVKPLKSAGLWSQIRRLNPCIGINLLASLVPLIALSGSALDTNHNLLTSDYSEALGWQTDGSTKYLSTGYTPSETVGGLSAYLRTAQTSSSTAFGLIGAQNSTFTQDFRIIFNRDSSGNTTAGAVQGLWGGANITNAGGGNSVTEGMYHVTRNSTTTLKFLKNGSPLSLNTTSLIDATANAVVTIMCINTQTSGVSSFLGANSRVAGYCVDAGMLNSDAANLYWIWQGFQTAMGRNV